MLLALMDMAHGPDVSLELWVTTIVVMSRPLLSALYEQNSRLQCRYTIARECGLANQHFHE